MAAVLHDVVEDTDVGLAALRELGMPEEVLEAVDARWRTARNTATGGYVEQVARNGMTRHVKLADLADNLANNTRLPETPELVARIDRYRRAVRRLTAAG